MEDEVLPTNTTLTPEEQASQEAAIRKARLARDVTVTYSDEEEEELWRNAKGQPDYDAVWKLKAARRLREAEARQKQEWNRSQAKLLLEQLGHAYTVYTEYVDQAPNMLHQAMANDPEGHKMYDQLRANLERANNAPRCAHVKASGERCRAPKERGKRFCHMHLAMQLARPQKLDLPALDDPNSIQLAIMKATQGLVDGTLDPKQAGMIGYYLQLASNNVGRVKFEPESEDEESDEVDD
ncbi:MAG TPA: hypothetical protein VJ723_12135 [Candidatus Angelobacter sp.]|nr:hypothetical protein [Candidatus Angelobacter sp.]